jgi:hypothetical protein
VRLFSLSILTHKIVLVVQSCRVPTSQFPGMVISVCRITNGGCGRKTLIVMLITDDRRGVKVSFSTQTFADTRHLCVTLLIPQGLWKLHGFFVRGR